MASGIFKLRDQLQGLVQKAWFQPPTYAGVFNGSSTQYLTVASNTAFAFGTNNFTIEFWYNSQSATSSTRVLSNISGGTYTTNTFVFDQVYNSAGLSFNVYNYSPSAVMLASTNTTIYQDKQWHHVAVVRNGNSWAMYIDGVIQGSAVTSSASLDGGTNSPIIIGNSGISGDTALVGYMSNLRIVKGVAVYTGNFTVPPTPLPSTQASGTNISAITGTQTSLLTLQNATFIDNSTNGFSITNTGSVTTIQSIFAGNNSSYATPAVEYLVVAGGGGGGSYYGGGGGAGGLVQGLINVPIGTSLTITIGAGGTTGTSSATGNSGLNSVFSSINAIGGGGGGGYSTVGTSGGSGGGAGNLTASGSGTSGQGNAGGSNTGGTTKVGGGGGAGTLGLIGTNDGSGWTGGNGGAGIASLISGTVTTYAGGGGGAADTSKTGGVGGVGGGGSGENGDTGTGSAGTVNTGGGGGGRGGSNGGRAGGSGICIISYPDTYNAPTTLTGTYTSSTSGSGSLSFNGSTQYITLSASASTDLGSSSFTYEFLYYCSSTTQRQGFLCSASDWWFGLDYQTGGVGLGLWASSNGSSWNMINSDTGGNGITNATPTLNSWNHIAVSRSGTSWAMWLNGTRILSLTVSGSIVSRSSEVKRIGTWAGAYNFALYGYLSNIRLVIGSAVYAPSSTTITVPTAPLIPITNTAVLLSTVSGAYLTDSSVNALTVTPVASVSWNQLSPFATGLGYKNRVYTWTASGTVTF